MVAPVVIAIVTTITSLVYPGSRRYVQDTIRDELESWVKTLNFFEIATDKINGVLSAKGVNLQFRDVSDALKAEEDIDRYIVARINAAVV